MESTKEQLYIVKTRTDSFDWSGFQGDNTNSVNILYNGKDEKFEFTLPETISDDYRLRDISSLVQLAFQEAQNSSIKLLSSYNRRTKWGEHYLKMKLEDALIKKLSKLNIVEPVISVQVIIDRKAIFQTETLISVLETMYPEDFDTDVQTFRGPLYNELAGSCSFEYSIALEWKTPTVQHTWKNKCNILEKLLSDKTLADCCILTGDNSEIKCHSSILAVNSDVFHAMLTSGLQESQSNEIELTDLSDNVVNELISYLYGQEINTAQMHQTTVFELLRAAHKYNIGSLERDMTDALLNKPETSYEMNVVLELYYFTVNIEQFHKLCARALDIMRRNPDDLVSSSAYQDLLGNDPKMAAVLALKLLKLGPN